MNLLISIVATASALHAAAPASSIPGIVCHGVAMKSACKGQDICIDDPQRLPDHTDFSFSPRARTYKSGDTIGRITSVEVGLKNGRIYAIDPPLFGGRSVEISSDGRKAKLAGGKDYYFFRCEKVGQ